AYPIPMAHGLTLGELAKMMVGEHWIDYEKKPALRVIKMKGWDRSMKWSETGLEGFAPSAKLPRFENDYVYLGTVVFEASRATADGRGTPQRFLTIGAPKTQLADSTLDRLRQQFPHVKRESAEFTPRSIPGKSLRPDQEGNLSHG